MQLAEAHEDDARSHPQQSTPQAWRDRLQTLQEKPGIVLLATRAAITDAAPSRRMFNVATFLILNGFLMMLMTVVA